MVEFTDVMRRLAYTRPLHVATRTGLMGVTTSNGTNLQLNSLTNHKVPIACSQVQPGWGSFWVNTGGSPLEANQPVDFSLITAGISHGGTSGLERLFFGGAPSGVLKQGGALIADPQGRKVAAGSSIGVSVHVETASSTPFFRGRGYVVGLGERFEEGATVTDRSLSGGVAAGTNTTFVPLVILGVPDNPLARSVALIGDSIGEGGTGDTADANGLVGYIEKGLGGNVPLAKFTRSGDKLSAWATRRYSRMAFIGKYFTDVIIELGTNDLYQDARTLVQIQTDMTALVQECQQRGLLVTMPTILPITTTAQGSTGWANADGSDQSTGGAIEVTRLAYNAWLVGGGLPGVIVKDMRPYAEIGSTGKWIAGLTGDGLHPGNTGSTALGAAFPPSSFGY